VNAVVTERRGRVLLITLNRPEAKNAIDGALARGLAAAVSMLDDDAGLTAGVLAGAGRGFSSGMDLKAFARGEDIAPAVRLLRRGARKPLIAAVEGFALAGGLELALACDLIVAAAGARLGIPEVKVGLFAAGGGVLRLPARVGYAKAMEMAITGEPITAEEAAGLGLVTRVAEPGRAVEEALELAGRVARNAPLAVAAAKEMIKAAQGVTEAEFWPIQDPRRAAVFASDDAREGPRAFAEKREPRWTGT
jgi:enoyl-CoA hydratase